MGATTRTEELGLPLDCVPGALKDVSPGRDTRLDVGTMCQYSSDPAAARVVAFAPAGPRENGELQLYAESAPDETVKTVTVFVLSESFKPSAGAAVPHAPRVLHAHVSGNVAVLGGIAGVGLAAQSSFSLRFVVYDEHYRLVAGTDVLPPSTLTTHVTPQGDEAPPNLIKPISTGIKELIPLSLHFLIERGVEYRAGLIVTCSAESLFGLAQCGFQDLGIPVGTGFPSAVEFYYEDGGIDFSQLELKIQNDSQAFPRKQLDRIEGKIDAIRPAAIAAHLKNIDGDLAAHGSAIARAIRGHDGNIGADLQLHHAGIADEIAAHNSTIAVAITAHDSKIGENLSAHDTNIDADLAAHAGRTEKRFDDLEAAIAQLLVDIEDLLKPLQPGVEEDKGRLGELIRLLHTRAEERKSDFPDCDGEPCEWKKWPRR
jgi:hypothetical protein